MAILSGRNPLKVILRDFVAYHFSWLFLSLFSFFSLITSIISLVVLPSVLIFSFMFSIFSSGSTGYIVPYEQLAFLFEVGCLQVMFGKISDSASLLLSKRLFLEWIIPSLFSAVMLLFSVASDCLSSDVTCTSRRQSCLSEGFAICLGKNFHDLHSKTYQNN